MKMRRLWKSGERQRESGQALVETGLIMIVGIMLLAGLIEFGWAYFRYLAMQSAAGEGAAYGMIHPDRRDSSDFPNPNNVVYRTQHESLSPSLDWSAAIVGVEAPFPSPGNLITVTVTYDHQLITPLLTSFLNDDSITLRAYAVQKIISPLPAP